MNKTAGWLATTRSEKSVLEQKLQTWKLKADNLKETKDQAEEKINKLENDLQRSESKVNAANIELKSTIAAMESNSQDNFVREELGQIRRDNDSLHQKLQEANKKVTCHPTKMGKVAE